MSTNYLFRGERLRIESTSNTQSLEMNDDAIDSKYTKGEVRIITEQARYPLPSIPNMLSRDDYNLNPEFQRRHRWSIEKRSRLIESFIMNVPIPPVFLYENEFSRYEVMDGLQRLTTIKEFYSDSFALKELAEWPELNGRKYSQLPEQVRRGIDRRYLSSVILLQETAKNPAEAQFLKQLVFERINSGGEQLTPQESRNAIYSGPLNDLCLFLSRNEHLCTLWGIPWKGGQHPTEYDDDLMQNPDYAKMVDAELVLRFFAYRQRAKRATKQRFRDFLDTYLRHGNIYPQEVLDQISDLFTNTIRMAYEIFGEKAFWLYRVRADHWYWLERPTTAVYDPLMFALSICRERWPSLLLNRISIQKNIEKLYRNNYLDFEGRNTNPSILNQRDKLFVEFLQSNSL